MSAARRDRTVRSAARGGAATSTRVGSRGHAAREALPAPLVWTFDGPFERCLADLEDTLRRAIVMVGDVVARRAADRPVAAGAAAPGRGRRSRCSRPGAASSNASPATACRPLPRVRHLRAQRSAGDAGHRLSKLTDREPHHVAQVLGSPPCPSR